MGIKGKFKNIKINKMLIILGFIVISAFLLLELVSTKKDNTMTEKQSESIEVYTVPEKEKVIINGKVAPVQSKDIFINLDNEEIDEIKVEDGKVVDKGMPLLTYKNESIISELNSKKEYLIYKEKSLENESSEEVKRDIEDEISNLKIEISKLEAEAYKTIVAPFKGKVYINDEYTNIESKLSPIMTIETEEFCINGQVSEEDLFKIRLNQEAEILINANKDKFNGKLSFIGERPINNQSEDTINNQNISYYSVKFDFNEGQDLSNIKNGFSVKVTLESNNQSIQIPKSALKQEDGKTYTFKVIDGIIYKQEVKLGKTKDDYAVIEEGVLHGDKIITDASDENIKDGEKVNLDVNNSKK